MIVLLRKAVQLPFELITVSGALLSSDYPKQWLKLALFSLLLSGFFSFVIVIARTPGLAELISDPMFARKSLVLHVDFALVVWFYAFLAALYVSLIRQGSPHLFLAGLKLCIFGSLLLIIPVFIPSADPVLANYIPVLDHPLFITGLLFFAAGLVVSFRNSVFPLAGRFPGAARLMKPAESGSIQEKPSYYTHTAAQTIRYAGIVIIVAVLTFITSFIITGETSTRTMYYELVMWGGGHILQFANVIGMVTVWMILIKKLTGQELVAPSKNRWLIAFLAFPAILSPLLLLQGTGSQLYYSGFTQLMRWFIFPVVTIYIIAGIWKVWMWRNSQTEDRSLFRSLYFNGFMVSVLLTVLGFILGAMIRGSNTLVPAHYHASLGGVTVAYMVMVFIFMKEYGYEMVTKRGKTLKRLQPLFFGIGQTVFVIGFGLAGMMGTGRKLFGQDQSIYTPEALIGLAFMSIGGLLAMAGGLLFIYIIIKSYKNGQYRKHT